MKYEKPELKIEKFSIIDEITAENDSTPGIIIDESNGNQGDLGFETLGEALGNIFGI